MQKHKILSFLLALFAAILLWVYAVTVVNPDDQTSIRGVPVRFTGISELQMNQLMLTGGEVQHVDVEIAGRRSDLKELNSTTLSVVADVGRINGPGTYELSWTLDPPSTVASGDIKLVSSSTNKIKVKVSEFCDKAEIPVQIEYEGAVAEGFARDPAVTSTDTVSVSGPAEEIEKIAFARVLVELNETKSSLDRELEYVLVGEDGEKLELSSYVQIFDPTIRVMIPVFCFRQIKLELEIIPGGGATAEDVVFTIDPPVIGVVGDEEILKTMPSTLVIQTVKLEEIREGLSTTLIPELPAGVTFRNAIASVHVALKFEGLATRTIYIPTDQIIRENDNGELNFIPERIPITVRGKANEIYGLNAGMIHVTADMTNDLDSKTMTVRLEVSLGDEIHGGVLGKYTVSVTEKTEDADSDEKTGNG